MYQIRDLEIQSCVPFKAVLNFRDLGGYPVAGGLVTNRGKFYRAPSLYDMTGADRALMLSLGINCIVDLRTQGEMKREPDPFGEGDGIKIYNLPLIDNLNSGADSLINLTLAELYIHLAANKQDTMHEIFSTFARYVDKGACVFHCTAGKDRTGIVAALLLMLAGVSDEDVVCNYAATHILMEPVFAQRKERMLAAGMTVHDSLFASDSANILGFIDHIKTHYGTSEGYLGAIGMARCEIDTLRSALVG